MKPEKPELGKYMDKRLAVALNGGRAVEGVLRGYDQFLNLVLDQVRLPPQPTPPFASTSRCPSP